MSLMKVNLIFYQKKLVIWFFTIMDDFKCCLLMLYDFINKNSFHKFFSANIQMSNSLHKIVLVNTQERERPIRRNYF